MAGTGHWRAVLGEATAAPWDAGLLERASLDFKETPETAWTVEQKSARNVGKARKALLTDLAEDAACMANAGGGTLVIGVRNKAPDPRSAVAGVSEEYTTDEVRLAIYRGTSPPLAATVTDEVLQSKRIIVVEVPAGVVVHATTGGVYKWRVGDQCLPIPPESLRGLSASRGTYDWSQELSEHGPEALSGAALAAAAERLRSIGADELADQAESDRRRFLESCDLLEFGRVRRAALVLYGGTEALASLPDWGAVLTSGESSGSEGSILFRREDGRSRPLVLLIEDLLARLEALARTESFRVGAAEVRMVDYPRDVVRELVANAFAHRDWEQPGVIEIGHSPDALILTSPGDLLPTLHEDRLLRESAQRNRVLSREITRLRIAEGAGMGFDRVFRSLAALGKDAPRFRRGPRFTVEVPGGQGERAFARFLNGPEFPEPRLASDLDVLLVLSHLRRRQAVTAAAAAPILQRDEDFADGILRRMHGAGLLEPSRSTATRRRPSYRLSPASAAALRSALTYRTGDIDADDAKLLRHLKRHRRIANEDVRGYLDCDVATARNRLTRLRQQGYITFPDDGPRRGRSVEYVATAAVDQFES